MASVFDSRRVGCEAVNDRISSTQRMPMPDAFRNARFTARVSATRIYAPCTSTVASNAQRCADGSQKVSVSCE